MYTGYKDFCQPVMENGCASIALLQDIKTLVSSFQIQFDGTRNKIKFISDFESLKLVIDELFKLSGEWSFIHNNDGYYCYKSSCLSITFYSGTKTVHMQGPKQDEIKRKLITTIKDNISGEDQDPTDESVVPEYDLILSERLNRDLNPPEVSNLLRL